MGDAKDLFLKDKDLSQKWAAWTHQPDCHRILMFADAEMLNHYDATQEMIRGALMYKKLLLSLADPDDEVGDLPQPGLRHDIDPRPRTKDSVKPKK